MFFFDNDNNNNNNNSNNSSGNIHRHGPRSDREGLNKSEEHRAPSQPHHNDNRTEGCDRGGDRDRNGTRNAEAFGTRPSHHEHNRPIHAHNETHDAKPSRHHQEVSDSDRGQRPHDKPEPNSHHQHHHQHSRQEEEHQQQQQEGDGDDNDSHEQDSVRHEKVVAAAAREE